MGFLKTNAWLNCLVYALLWRGTLSSPAPISPVITPAPALQRRADFPPDFIGYSIFGFSSDTWTCDLPFTYATDSVGFAGCCSTASCSIPRACSRNYLIYAGGVSSLCPSYCISAIISTSSEALTSTTLIDCAQVSDNIYLLRSSLEVESSTIESTTTESSSQATTSYTSSSPSTPTPTSTSSIAPSPPPPPKKSSSNKGPIIGGAVGGVVGIIALALIGFILFRKHKKNKQAYPAPGPAPPMAPGNAPLTVPNSPPPFYSNPASPTNNDGYYSQKSAAMTGAWPMDRAISPVPQSQAQSPQQYTEYPQIAEVGGTQLPAKGPTATELE